MSDRTLVKVVLAVVALVLLGVGCQAGGPRLKQWLMEMHGQHHH
jgi:hypothetical protein